MHADPWYRNAVIYALDIKSFQDSDGDGIGDFRGAIRRLDYLKNLGINCIWLLPFYRSPFRDNGYDVEDYFSISPELGSLEDFEEFVHRAGEQGIKVIIDLVTEHTSDQHPWFKASRRDPRSRFRDYYIWREAPPFDVQDKNVFPDREKGIWTYDELAHAYYCHHFHHFQPSLNFLNPDVIEEAMKIMDFWLSLGISGFRVDAVPFMMNVPSAESTRYDSMELLRRMRALLDARIPDGILLGESDLTVSEMSDHLGGGDQLNMLHNFILSRNLFLAFAREESEPLENYLYLTRDIPYYGHWCNFLRNLDELNLERLQEEDRKFVFEYYDPDGKAFIFHRGLRRRVAPLLGGNQLRMRLAFSLLFSMPGSPMIVYGDEIGMGDDLSLEGRKAIRTPMQWSSERNAGFSTSEQTIIPLILSGNFSYHEVNVRDQESEPGSILSWMKQLIKVRKMCPELGASSVVYLTSNNPEVLSSHCQWRGGHLLTFHNLSGRKIISGIKLGNFWHGDLHPLLGDAIFHLDHSYLEVKLEPYGFQWFREHVVE